ncbi:MAG: DNA polymerase III subunit gamma/tau [Eubacteriales bacterium]
MSYTALYRKFRPGEFQDVKGQDHIITTLKNQIEANRIGHAYLFCGTRGTGKTTVAKIFAKAVNCEHPIDGSPCGECDMCRTITSGASMNVIEIDAASNNGVDNIREIREEVAYRPTQGRYKVYIIDEVHMLSIGAFNALLKTLEEPPEYVIFILATTEVHKIPITILSRCQHYDFKRITIDTITLRLQALMNQEEVEVEERALRYIAKVADGSMRDALSLLDQCIAFYMGQILTYDNVLEVLGAVDTEMFSKLLRCVLKQDVAQVLNLLEELIMQGRELTQLVNDFTWYQRNLLLVKSSDNMEDVLDVSTENLAQLKEESEMVDAITLLRYIRIFSELSNQIKYATQKRILLEVALIKLCTPNMEVDSESVLERVRTIEDKLENGMPMQVVSRNENSYKSKDIAERQKIELPKALPEEIQEVAKNFRSIVNASTGLTKNYLKKARISLGANGKLLIVMEGDMDVAYVDREDNRKELEALIENKIGKRVEVEIRKLERDRKFDDVFPDLEQLVHMEIVVEEE